MSTSVEDLCTMLATAFSEGRIEDVAEYYVYPLVVYLPTGVRIEMTPVETAEAVFARRALALQAGMRCVRATVYEVRELEGGRFVAHLSWDFLNAGNRPIGRSEMRYFGRRAADGRLRLELIEFSELAFADRGGATTPTSSAN